MTATKFAPKNAPLISPPPSTKKRRMSKVARQASSTFNDISLARRWDEMESAITSMARSDGADESEVGWIEGRVHETRSTQKEIEILLVHAQDSDDATKRNEALKVFIACADYPLFAFSINQHIKVSLKGARIVREISSPGSSILPFSVVYSSSVVLQVIHGGVCMPDGTVVDTSQKPESCGERCFLSAAGFISLLDATPTSTISPESRPRTPLALLDKTPPSQSRKSPAPETRSHEQKNNNSNAIAAIVDGTTYPALSTLSVGMATPLIGIVESAKTPTTATTGDTFVSLTLADASSYESGSGFKVTCFTSSRLTRELPAPSMGDVILLKNVKITKFPNGSLIGTVTHSCLDWVVYSAADKAISTPRHATVVDGDTAPDPFYQNLEQKKEGFEQFIEAMDSGPARKYALASPKAISKASRAHLRP